MEPIKGQCHEIFCSGFFIKHRLPSQFKKILKFAEKISRNCPFKTIERRESRHGQKKTQNYMLSLIQHIFPLLLGATQPLLAQFPRNCLKTTSVFSPLSFSMFQVDGTELSAEWAFSSLQKFGQEFLKKIKGKKMPNKLLEKVRKNFVLYYIYK